MNSTSRTYVWTWLPGASTPIPSGVLAPVRDGLSFTYGRRYLERADAISLSPTLPLQEQAHPPVADHGAPTAIRDSAPDAWGRRVVLHTLTGARGSDADLDDLDETTYMLASGSNRLGAIDFQESPFEYIDRGDSSTLDDLHEAASIIESGGDLPPALHDALLSGTAMGGARPKAMITGGGKEHLAKFPVSTDPLPVIGSEAASVYLAREVGIRVPNAMMVESRGKNTLLTERFDRPGGGRRRHVVSALTLLGLGEMSSRHGTYLDILDALQENNSDPTTNEELYLRVAFNIAISNTDDHLRNHAAFWDGQRLELTPAYDLAPGPRSGETASQTTAYTRNGERSSNLSALVDASAGFGIPRKQGHSIVTDMVSTIKREWGNASDFAGLSMTERHALWGRQFLNPGSLYGLERTNAPSWESPRDGTGPERARTVPGTNSGSFAPKRNSHPRHKL